PFPVDHVYGQLTWVDNLISLDLRAPVAGTPVHCFGTIENPGPQALVHLEFQADAVPIEERFLKAIPPDIPEVVDEFQPPGSVPGWALVRRSPPTREQPDPKGIITFDAVLDLNEHCGITWSGLPYPITNLTGQLELHPNHWIFRNMRGF